MGSVKGLSLYEKQDTAIRSVSPEASIEKMVHNSWIKLTQSFFESGQPLVAYQAVVDRRATTDGNGGYQVFCTVEDGDGNQADVQISDFTLEKKELLAKIFNWKVAETKPTTNTTAPTAGVPADFTEIKELLRQQAENLDNLENILYQVQNDSQRHFRDLEQTLAGQDKAHAQRVQDMKADYDRQLLDLLDNMRQQHEEFVHSINIKLDGGNREQEIARLKLTVELQEKMLNRVGDRVRFMDGSFETLWERLLQQNNRTQNAMDPNMAENIVEEQKRLLEEHRKLLEQMQLMTDTLGEFGVASEQLQQKTDLMSEESLKTQKGFQDTLENLNKKLDSEIKQNAEVNEQFVKRVETISENQNLMKQEIADIAKSNRDALHFIVQNLENFVQKMKSNQNIIVEDQLLLKNSLAELTKQLQEMQKEGKLHNKALSVLVEELNKLKSFIVTVNQGGDKDQLRKIQESLEEIKDLLTQVIALIQPDQEQDAELNLESDAEENDEEDAGRSPLINIQANNQRSLLPTDRLMVPWRSSEIPNFLNLRANNNGQGNSYEFPNMNSMILRGRAQSSQLSGLRGVAVRITLTSLLALTGLLRRR